MTRARVGGISLGYEVRGEAGDWVLLVHGLGYARWGWAWQIDDLARDFRVIAFDNRGIGESEAPPGPYSVREMAEDAAGLLGALGVERAHVVGTSLGGFIAQELALGWPQRVGRLVLACTSPGGPGAYGMPESTARLIERAPSLPEEERLRAFVENALSDGFPRERPDVVERIMAYRRATAQPLEAWAAQAAAGAAFDVSGRAGEIRAETLVVTGTEDRVVDPRNSRLLAEAIPGATFVEMAGGHLFFIERAERFNALARAFLSGGRAAVEAGEWS